MDFSKCPHFGHLVADESSRPSEKKAGREFSICFRLKVEAKEWTVKSFFIQMKSASLVSSLEKEVVVARRRQNVTSILYSIWRDCKKFILEFRISDSISVLFPALWETSVIPNSFFSTEMKNKLTRDKTTCTQHALVTVYSCRRRWVLFIRAPRSLK